jgi:hypothetical protein
MQEISRTLKNEEIYLPLVFFVAMGFIVPNYDSIHYFFLLNTCKLTVAEYDMLSIVPYVGLVFGTIIYLKVLRKIEVRKLVLASLIIRFLVTLAQIANVMRLNLKIGFNDFYYNLTLMAINRASLDCLCILPVTVMLTYVLPKPIEASMFAFIQACLCFSSDWGSTLMGAIICHLYRVDQNDDGSNYTQVLVIKLPLVITMVLMINFITLNQNIASLAHRMNQRTYIDIYGNDDEGQSNPRDQSSKNFSDKRKNI